MGWSGTPTLYCLASLPHDRPGTLRRDHRRIGRSGRCFRPRGESSSCKRGRLLVAIFSGTVVGWTLFPYWRRAFHVRMLLPSALVGGSLLLACIVNVLYSRDAA